MMNIKTILFPVFIVLATFQISCKKEEQKIFQTTTIKTDSMKIDAKAGDVISAHSSKVYDFKYLEMENVLVNGHKVYLDKKEFDALYKNKIDSNKTDIWECGTPFEWLDEKWMAQKYGPKSELGDLPNFDGKITTIYVKNIEFNTNNHMVLFNSGNVENNSFHIVSHNITLDKNTKLKDFKKLFPKGDYYVLEDSDEMHARFSIGKNDVEDAFHLVFKNGKLELVTLWWLLC